MSIQLETAAHEVVPTRSVRAIDNETKRQTNQVWDRLAERIGAQKFDMWFAHTTLNIDSDRLELSTGSPFVARWIESRFTEDLRDVAHEAFGRNMQVRVNVAAAKDAEPLQPTTAPAAEGNGRLGTKVNGETRRAPTLRRLSDFIVGSCNKLAYSEACRLAEDPNGRSISPLFIHGDCGVGKTHLLQGICHRYIELTNRPQQVRYVTGEQFTNEFITAVRNDTIDAFRQRLRKLDLLAIDDVHFLSNKTRTQTEFLYTLDAIDLSGARVVLASDNHPHQIKRFDKSLVSRFLAGMVVKMDRPDRATRIELIQRLARKRGLRIQEAALELIVANCVGSVREIEGAITKLAAYRSLMNGHDGVHSHNGHTSNGHASNGHSSHGKSNGNGHANQWEQEIGMVLADRLFKDEAWQPANVVRLAGVIDAVCARLAVTKADLMGSGRHRRVVVARGLVAYLARELTTHSFPEIAQGLGRVNHSTIHTADHRLRRQLAENPHVELGGSDGKVNLQELIDQLRHDVVRARVT